jgi:DNA-binding NarL/FixJ family response regulator
LKDKDIASLEFAALREYIMIMQGGGNLAAHVRLAINEELTERQRELITMYYLEGMSMSEIARVLGLSPSTVSRTMKRGRERLRKHFKYNGRMFLNGMLE